MTGLSLASFDRPLAPGTRTPGGAPEWVHLLPDGHMTGRDGREFNLVDPAALVLAFQSGGLDLVIDYEHASARPEVNTGNPVPAAGWIKELRADATGLWGRVEWTAKAAALIAAREYRHLSPAFLHAKSGEIVSLKGAALTHTPNLRLQALNSQDAAMPTPDPTGPTFADLVALFGLAGDATAKDILRAVLDVLKRAGGAEPVALMSQLFPGASPPTSTPNPNPTPNPTDAPDPAQFMPVAAVRAMLAEQNLALATATEQRREAKVADAFRRGYLTGPMRQWATALCASDEAAFDGFIASTLPPLAHLFDKQPPPSFAATHARPSEPTQGDVAAAICAQLGLRPGSLDR